MANSPGTGNTAPGLTTVTAMFFCWAFLTYIVRAWVKLRKSDNWGADDNAISASLLVALGYTIAACHAVNHGYGNPWSTLSASDTITVDMSLYAAQILYIASVGLTKVSTSFFTARFLTREQYHIRLAHSLTSLSVLWCIASIIFVAIRGDLSEPWRTRDGSRPLYLRWMVIEISSLVLESCAVASSIHFVWGLHMPLRKRLFVSAIFAGRLLLVPVVGIRLWKLSPSENIDLASPSVSTGEVTAAALELAFILASITCLKPFLRPFHEGWVVSTAGHTGGAGYTTPSKSKSSRSDTYLMLSTPRSTTDNMDGTISHTGPERKPDGPVQRPKPTVQLRPDHVSHQATGVSGERRSDEVDLTDGRISKTQAWTVSYDDDRHGNSKR